MSFRDLMAKAGFSTERSDNPRTVGDFIDDGLGSSAASDSTDSAGGASMRLLDVHYGMLPRNSVGSGSVVSELPNHNNDIKTKAIPQKISFVDPKLPQS